MPNKYKVYPAPINAQMPIKTSRFNKPQCITRSAFERNLKASASSANASTFFTVSSQPPDLGSDFNQFGNMANNAKGNASAKPKPANPLVSGQAPPLNEPTNKEPSIGPVQENETIASVSAIKKIPPILPNPLFESALPAMPLGSVISKKPKKEIAKKIKMIKKIILSVELVEILLKISGFTLPKM